MCEKIREHKTGLFTLLSLTSSYCATKIFLHYEIAPTGLLGNLIVRGQAFAQSHSARTGLLRNLIVRGQSLAQYETEQKIIEYKGNKLNLISAVSYCAKGNVRTMRLRKRHVCAV